MLPCLRQHGENKSSERNCLSDLFQQELRDRLEIKLVVSSGTSLITDGLAGYTESMQIIHDWSQAHFFKMGQEDTLREKSFY